MADQSITQWLDGIREGDGVSAQKLWKANFLQLTGLARNRLRSSPKRVAYEEDVALSAFASFCQHAAQGRFPVLNDRDDLWKVLFTITDRKSMALLKRERRQKRGGGHVRGESALIEQGGSECGLDQFPESPKPTPEMAEMVTESMRSLLDRLVERQLIEIAIAKMEGFTVDEIADRKQISARSIKRKLKVIRNVWLEELL
jgi:DNA-directed RNA polymerase specialized sigma24 family protein